MRKMSTLAEKIANIKHLDEQGLEVLAHELRELIIKIVTKNGGHLASNLGVVELTMALFYVFNFPEDRIVWDVGHQTYVYKILSDRLEKFDTIRQPGGISGFPKTEESIYDAFNTGHSSTSISAALGIAAAKHLAGEPGRVLAVIGDGALTGGMAFEALNHAGHLKEDLIVILNDNEMSIAPNVGAISQYLTNLRTAPKYRQKKAQVQNFVRKIPFAGKQMANFAEKLKDSLKHLLMSSELFEQFGFTYIGPIDGHDLAKMIKIMQRVREIKGPILIHCITKKGKGYAPAEENPNNYHGIAPFTMEDEGEPLKNHPKSFTKIFGEKILAMGKEKSDIVAITAAMVSGTGLDQFSLLFPERFFDVGIAEGHAVTFAAGLAIAGKRPVVAIYSTFIQRAIDQIIHDVALQKLPVIFILDRAGLVGADGETHHGLFDTALLAVVPNLILMAPKNAQEIEEMLELAYQLKEPVVIRIPRGIADSNISASKVELGKLEIIQEGNDIAFLTYGSIYSKAQQAIKVLENDYSCGLYNLRFAKPLDEISLEVIAKKYKLLVTVEEEMLIGGIGCMLNTVLQKLEITTPTLSLGVDNCFVTHGSQTGLQRVCKLDEMNIVEAVLQKLKGK